MNGFTEFLAINYIWFIVITVILVFALVGYLVDAKEIKDGKVKNTKDSELKIIDFSTVDQSKSLGASINDAGANNLNLDTYASQAPAPDNLQAGVQAAGPMPVVENQVPIEKGITPEMQTVSENSTVDTTQQANTLQDDPNNPMYGSTTNYQPTQSLEKTQLQENISSGDGLSNNATLNEDDSASINVV